MLPAHGAVRITHIMLCATIALTCSAFAGGVSALWPVPIHYSAGNTTLVLDAGFTIEFTGPSGPVPSGSVDTSGKVSAAISRTYSLVNDGFIPDMLYTFEANFEPTEEELSAAPRLTKLLVTQKFASPLRD